MVEMQKNKMVNDTGESPNIRIVDMFKDKYKRIFKKNKTFNRNRFTESGGGRLQPAVVVPCRYSGKAI